MLTLASGVFLGGGNLAIVPIAAAILYGIVLPLLLCGALVPRKNYGPSPRALRTFVTVGLLPILAALGMIFYLYLGKILVTDIWPGNEVCPYVIFGSCVGLAFLVFFCSMDKGDSAAKYYLRIFPLFWLLPLLMLFISAGIRIADQGLTPMRMLLITFGIWVLFCLVFALFKKEAFHVKVLPAAAAVLLIFCLVLPYGNVFSLSKHAQLARLDRALEAANMGNHDHIYPNAEASEEQKRVILSAADYLLDETNALLCTSSGQKVTRGLYDAAFGFSNIPAQEYWQDDYSFLTAEPVCIDTGGTTHLFRDLYLDEGVGDHLIGQTEALGTLSLEEGWRIRIQSGEGESIHPLRPLLLSAIEQEEAGREIWYQFDLPDAPLRVVIRDLSYSRNADGSIRIEHAAFDLLVLEG